MIRGSVAIGYEAVGAEFRGFFERQWDVGSGVSVYVGGVPVVQLTGGVRLSAGDAESYDATTIQLVASYGSASPPAERRTPPVSCTTGSPPT